MLKKLFFWRFWPKLWTLKIVLLPWKIAENGQRSESWGEKEITKRSLGCFQQSLCWLAFRLLLLLLQIFTFKFYFFTFSKKLNPKKNWAGKKTPKLWVWLKKRPKACFFLINNNKNKTKTNNKTKNLLVGPCCKLNLKVLGVILTALCGVGFAQGRRRRPWGILSNPLNFEI